MPHASLDLFFTVRLHDSKDNEHYKQISLQKGVSSIALNIHD